MSKRILVVEDQSDNRQIIRDMLAPTDYEISEAENGEEALAAIAKQRPDLILMDIQLPIMDGYTAVSKSQIFRKEDLVKLNAPCVSGAPRYRIRHLPVMYAIGDSPKIPHRARSHLALLSCQSNRHCPFRSGRDRESTGRPAGRLDR
jgi:CheY-like chemotaxis protein